MFIFLGGGGQADPLCSPVVVSGCDVEIPNLKKDHFTLSEKLVTYSMVTKVIFSLANLNDGPLLCLFRP